MYSSRGRGGSRQPTPANVQCQKCLKRGHYSYECKSTTQDRPYTSRPSRSQQLRNPKLVPKLTNDSLKPLVKEGAADAQLAKLEEERAKKRSHEDDVGQGDSKRRRSASSDSVSTISTRSSRSPSPPQTGAHSPPSEPFRKPRHRETASRGRSISRSPPPRQYSRSVSRDSRSPPRESQREHRRRDDVARRGRAKSLSPSRSRSREPHSSRAPGRRAEAISPYSSNRDGGKVGRETRDDRPARDRDHRRPESAVQSPQRERSLSPFSKRLQMSRGA